MKETVRLSVKGRGGELQADVGHTAAPVSPPVPGQTHPLFSWFLEM